MVKCEHDNYVPDWSTDGLAPYCSGCQVSEIGIVQQTEETKRLEDEWAKILTTTN